MPSQLLFEPCGGGLVRGERAIESLESLGVNGVTIAPGAVHGVAKRLRRGIGGLAHPEDLNADLTFVDCAARGSARVLEFGLQLLENAHDGLRESLYGCQPLRVSSIAQTRKEEAPAAKAGALSFAVRYAAEVTAG